MASKQELGNEIAKLKREKRELELHNAEQSADLSRLRHEDRRRQEHNRLEAQRKREEQQLKERREHLDHLGAGRLPLKGAKSWAFVHEQGEQPGIEVFVPLDDEELRVLQDHLRPKPKPRNTFADLRDRVMPYPTPIFHRDMFGIWDDLIAGRRPSAIRV